MDASDSICRPRGGAVQLAQPLTPANSGYILVDAGGGRRLERFGAPIVDRPSPAAIDAPRDSGPGTDPDLRWDRSRGWQAGPGEPLDPWTIAVDGLRLELRPTETGQVGLFPEHLAMLAWLRDRVAERSGPMRPVPDALNLFAYTGLATLALAAAGAAVAHVDGSRPTVAWARRNAELSGLADRPIRWLVDDARTFVGREVRRGRTHDGLVLDPPSYGHGEGGRAWRLERDLEPLLDACRAVLDARGFVLLTAHTPGFGPERLAGMLAAHLGRPPSAVDAGELTLDARSGARLTLGAFARLAG